MITRRRAHVLAIAAALAMIAALPATGGTARASTYAVYIPLDSSIYDELSTLNGLGYLDTYIAEIKPITRVEAARLVIEAERNLNSAEDADLLARRMIHTLKLQLSEELGWLRSNTEDQLPTMIEPIDRVEAQYLFERGPRRYWHAPSAINATEGTPLLQNADGLPTAPGSNEVLRLAGWAGFGGFLTFYGEGAMAGPITRQIDGQNRFQPIDAESVVSLGNVAISFGTEEMRWGTGHFAPLSQGANAAPFPALRIQNIHPKYLPWIFRYLGPGRRVLFMGQLDGNRSLAQHPWIVGHITSFKPLPWFEFGLTRAIIFGGRGNDHYNFGGFLGRFTGLSTGSPSNGQTNSRGGIYLKFYIPRLRGTQIYQEILGEDNLTKEIPGVGRFIPFLAVSYQGGVYVPRLTADGLTDLRFEYAILEPNYSTHDESEDWEYNNQFMGDPLGPNATQVDMQIGRWFDLEYKLSLDVFYTEQAPQYGTDFPYPTASYPYPLTKEHSVGAAIDFLRLGTRMARVADSLATVQSRLAIEYADHLNYDPSAHSVRILFVLSTSLRPDVGPWKWN
ncbi:MAG: capsule assembly Wzi family protein [Candidatus Binataceae bacterium]